MLALSLRHIASHSETIQRHPALSQRDTMASGKARHALWDHYFHRSYSGRRL
jgi:hypothetical protein